jgi:hypothetical protein
MRLKEPYALDLEYTRAMMGFLLFRREPSDIALIGLGGGSTLVALFTDFLFRSDLAVGKSLALANGIVAPLAALVLWWGLPHFRRSAAALARA